MAITIPSFCSINPKATMRAWIILSPSVIPQDMIMSVLANPTAHDVSVVKIAEYPAAFRPNGGAYVPPLAALPDATKFLITTLMDNLQQAISYAVTCHNKPSTGLAS